MISGLITEKYIDNTELLFNYLLFGSYRNVAPNFLFRGLRNDAYKLLPTILRPENQIKYLEILDGSESKISSPYSFQKSENYQQYLEFEFLKRFYLTCNQEGLPLPDCPSIRSSSFFEGGVQIPENYQTWLPEELYDVAALAQHFGIPTRLLDWSTDFITALYFACDDAEMDSKGNHVVLWILNPYFVENIKAFITKGFPLKFIHPPYFQNPNLSAQKGVLTLWETPIRGYSDHTAIDRTPLEELIVKELEPLLQNELNFFQSSPTFGNDYFIMQKLLIPKSEASRILKTLEILGYSEAKIYPGYKGVASSIIKSKNKSRYIPFA
ncbi:FRG domain-containing protein [Pontibacter sp. CAU 1760]